MIFCKNTGQCSDITDTINTIITSSGNSTSQSHLCVFVITVGGQKHFGYFIHATEEERKLRLLEVKTDSTPTVTGYSWCICRSTLVYSRLWPHTSPGFQQFFLLRSPEHRNREWTEDCAWTSCRSYSCLKTALTFTPNDSTLKWTQSTPSRTSWNMLL